MLPGCIKNKYIYVTQDNLSLKANTILKPSFIFELGFSLLFILILTFNKHYKAFLRNDLLLKFNSK